MVIVTHSFENGMVGFVALLASGWNSLAVIGVMLSMEHVIHD